MLKQKPINKYLTYYLDYFEIEKGLSAKSQENYARFLKKFFTWIREHQSPVLRPEQLKNEHILKYRVFLSRHTDPTTKKTLKKSTQNYYLIALRSLLEFFSERSITSLPPTKVKLAKDKKDKEIKFLNLDQIEKLLLSPDTSTEPGLRDKAILESFFSTGLRISELSALNRDQLKIKNSTKDLEISILGKGEHIRTVYFSSRAVEALKNYLNKRIDIDPALFINYKPGAEKQKESRRLSNRSIENIVKKYVKIAGLPVMATPHTLRHSFATDLLSNGVDLRLVQEFLGHQNIATTQIYTHVTNKQLKDIHKKLHGGKNIKK